jgi:hypothetical protein
MGDTIGEERKRLVRTEKKEFSQLYFFLFLSTDFLWHLILRTTYWKSGKCILSFGLVNNDEPFTDKKRL